jgi:hypothetical protein
MAGKTLIWVPHIADTMDFNTKDNPIVIMMIEMTGSPIIGLRTNRSMDRARMMEKAIVRMKPAQT